MNLSEAIKYGEANYSKLPLVLQKSYDFINKVTKNGSDLDSYKANESIKNTIDLAISKFSEMAVKSPKSKAGKKAPLISTETKEKIKPSKNKKSDTKIIKYSDGTEWRVVSKKYAEDNWKKKSIYKIYPTDESESLIEDDLDFTDPDATFAIDVQEQKTGKKTKSKNSTKKVTKEKPDKSPVAENMVELLPLEIQFMKRFCAMHGKEKAPKQVMNLLDAIQKAIIEKRVRKTSPFAKEVDEMQKALIKTYNSMIDNKVKSIEIKIDSNRLERFTGIINKYQALKSVALIKRYINLDGEKQTKEKALKLKTDIQKILQTPDFYKDPYAKTLNEIELHLINYTNGVDKQLKIDEQALAGIPWAAIAAKGVNAARSAKNFAMKAFTKVKPATTQPVARI